jgi:hypothetical protein
MLVRFLTTSALAVTLAGALAAPAFAQGSIGGGIFTQSGNGSSSTGAGIILSTGAALPILPVSLGVTAFGAISHGSGYAITADGKLGFGGTSVGVGYGLGQFGAGHAGGTATIFLDERVAPFTAIELRGYRTTTAHGSTAAFAGLKFTL